MKFYFFVNVNSVNWEQDNQISGIYEAEAVESKPYISELCLVFNSRFLTDESIKNGDILFVVQIRVFGSWNFIVCLCVCCSVLETWGPYHPLCVPHFSFPLQPVVETCSAFLSPFCCFVVFWLLFYQQKLSRDSSKIFQWSKFVVVFSLWQRRYSKAIILNVFIFLESKTIK